MKREDEKVLCIVQARMSSTRLPGKVLKQIAGKPMLWYLIERLKLSTQIDKIVIATSDHAEDYAIEQFCRELNLDCFRGDLDDVLKRFSDCARKYSEYKIVVRVTGDCPLIDPEVVDKLIRFYKQSGKENIKYVSNVLKETYPDGIDAEVFSQESLFESEREAELGSEREHVTLYIRNNPKYKKVNIENEEDFSRFRLTVDNPEDFEVVSFLIKNFGYKASFTDYCNRLMENPNIMIKNAKIIRNEGLLKSLKEDQKHEE